MKHIILASLVALPLFIAGCDSGLTHTQVESSPQKSPVLTTDASGELVLSKATAADKAFAVSWTAASYGAASLPAAYSLEFDKADGNFESPHKLEISSANQKFNVTQQALSSIMVGELKLSPDTKETFKIRLKANTHPSLALAYSNVIMITATPFDPFIRKFLFIEGQPREKALSAYAPLANGAPQSAAFEAYAYFPANAKVKIHDAFDENSSYWGDSNGTLAANGSPIAITAEGTYRLQFNIALKTYTLLKVSWGIIGDATPNGWNSDTDFAYDQDKKLFVIEDIALLAKEIKFRANDDWNLNYGGALGALVPGGSNIAVADAGNYKIELDLSNATNYKANLIKK